MRKLRVPLEFRIPGASDDTTEEVISDNTEKKVARTKPKEKKCPYFGTAYSPRSKDCQECHEPRKSKCREAFLESDDDDEDDYNWGDYVDDDDDYEDD